MAFVKNEHKDLQRCGHNFKFDKKLIKNICSIFLKLDEVHWNSLRVYKPLFWY